MTLSLRPCPETIEELDDLLSQPDDRIVQTMREIDGDIVVLGVGGKMGPTFARMIKLASDRSGTTRRIIGVSRFSSKRMRDQLECWGIETIACDLLDSEAIEQLPDADHIVSMLGFKFGTADNPSMTWAMNCYLPSVICRRYRDSRITAFSSGNVYGMIDVDSCGSRESDPLRPIGEYAVSVLGRERMYDFFSRSLQIPITLLRLNYATELRYGVLVDLAQRVFNRVPIDITMGYVNVIWQRDANAMAINSLVHGTTPPKVFNIAGPEILRVREVCDQFSQLMDRPVKFLGQEAGDAYLNDARHNHALLGQPTLSATELICWTAQWVMRAGESFNKPTHYENRDGGF